MTIIFVSFHSRAVLLLPRLREAVMEDKLTDLGHGNGRGRWMKCGKNLAIGHWLETLGSVSGHSLVFLSLSEMFRPRVLLQTCLPPDFSGRFS